MANVYSDTRPPFANGPQTPLYKSMQEYANQPQVQALVQKLCSDLFCERPDDALEYISKWVEREKVQRQQVKSDHS